MKEEKEVPEWEEKFRKLFVADTVGIDKVFYTEVEPKDVLDFIREQRIEAVEEYDKTVEIMQYLASIVRFLKSLPAEKDINMDYIETILSCEAIELKNHNIRKQALEKVREGK